MSSPKKLNSPPLPSDLGRRGEELAAAYLDQLGFQIVAANFTVPVGRNRNDAVVSVEIDLVAYEGPVLCFVEVKTRASDWFASPTANVDLRKQRQVTVPRASTAECLDWKRSFTVSTSSALCYQLKTKRRARMVVVGTMTHSFKSICFGISGRQTNLVSGVYHQPTGINLINL
ncbi:MAG: YraN family protein [Acidobacteriota bacterium]|nr:YraN family protein [Acidobacteriota bacterium]